MKEVIRTTIIGNCCAPLLAHGSSAILEPTPLEEIPNGTLAAVTHLSSPYQEPQTWIGQLQFDPVHGVVLHPTNPESKHGPMQITGRILASHIVQPSQE